MVRMAQLPKMSRNILISLLQHGFGGVLVEGWNEGWKTGLVILKIVLTL
jgi:hypothetical protein